MTQGTVTRISYAMFGAVAGAVLVALVAACTPEQISTVKSVAAPVVKGACVLLRAFTDDGLTLDICATAEELAPLIPELLEERAAPPPPEAAADAGLVVPTLAFALEAPRKRITRRRCTAWQKVGADADSGSGRDVASRSEGGSGALDGSLFEGGRRGAGSDGGRAEIDGGK